MSYGVLQGSKVMALGLSLIVFPLVGYANETVGEDCPDISNLVAEYKISYSNPEGEAEAFQLTLVRYEGAVLQENSLLKVADQWFLESNGQISRKQYFDEYRQGIEYASKEANQAMPDKDWQTKFSLLNDNALADFKATREESENCEERVFMVKGDSGNQRITWREDLLLPESWELVRQGGITNQLELVSVNFDQAKVKALFHQRDSFKLTDYADIGDSEDNPEIQQMLGKHLIDHDHH